VEIQNGKAFFELLKYLKHVDNGLFVFSANGIKYNDLTNKSTGDPKKEQWNNMGNTCELFVNSLHKYIFESDTIEYELFFNIKDLKDMVKSAKVKDIIKMYKVKDNNQIYVTVLKGGVSNNSISYITPLSMVNYNIFLSEIENENENEAYPNCVIDPKTFRDDCTKIVSTDFPKVMLRCKNTFIEIKTVSSLGNNGHLFQYGSEDTVIKFNVDFSNLNLNLGNIAVSPPPKVNILKCTGDIIINLTAPAYKGLSGLSQLSNNPIKFYFDNNNYVKIVSNISNYGIIRTYIKTDEIIR
jgi:hypothetical protein